ncbi:MAG: sulfotransferase [Microthrixaceae bacterium]
MSERYERPAWVRRMNAMATAGGGAPAVVPIDADQLLRSAMETTGLEFADLGDGDWEGRFRTLTAAIDGNPGLHVVGRMITREELLRCLRTRLYLGAARAAELGMADEQIVAPIAVVGPARSGTTIAFELLGLDEGLRTPVAADVLHAASPLDAADRHLATECEQELWADIQPEFAAIHELRSDLPVECITISMPSFAGNHWLMALQDLGDWTPDPEADFALHRAVLQAAQFGKPPKSWLIKTPAYLMAIDDLVAAYPDVSVVQTHRDPAKTMPSTVSTTAMIQWLRTDDVDLDTLAPLIGAIFGEALASVTARRASGDFPVPVGDLRFTDLVADPVRAIEAAYGELGRELAPGHAAAIDAYVANKPKGKFGAHRYTAEEWGFSAQTLRTDLADYLEHFDIVTEV